MSGVVDSHVHLLPERLGTAIRAFFAGAGISPERFAYPIDTEVVCEALAQDGVVEAWTLPYARRPGAAGALNEAVAAIAARCSAEGPVAVLAGATVHPGDGDPAGVVRDAVTRLGARVLKLHCSVGEFSPDDPRLDPVWAYASDIRLPVVVHAGHAVSGHTAGEELEPIATVARRWPEARVVIAHCGHRAAARALELLAEHPCLHADLTPVVDELVVLPATAPSAPGRGPVETVADRVLFGSDAPNTAFRVADALAVLDGLPQAVREAVTGGNARRLQAELAP